MYFYFKGPDVPQRSETPFDESGDNQAIHVEQDISPSCTPSQEDETQLTFRYKLKILQMDILMCVCVCLLMYVCVHLFFNKPYIFF